MSVYNFKYDLIVFIFPIKIYYEFFVLPKIYIYNMFVMTE